MLSDPQRLARTHRGTDDFYVRGNLEGFNEETLADFLANNREQHPIEPNFNPGDA